MRKTLLGATVLCGLGGIAQAVPITGQISINGTNTFNATTVTPNNPGNVGPLTSTGSYLTDGFGPGCTGCVTANPFTYNVVGAHTPVTVYTATLGANAASFILNNIVSESNVGLILSITATGLANLTGFDQTPGTFLFSSQGNGVVNTTFSATTIATGVPEPLSLGVLGLGLFGLGLVRRRKQTNV
jgi:hypothetical protein